MKIAFLEYEFDFNNQIAGGADICVRNMYSIMAESHEVSSYRIEDYKDKLDILIELLDTNDLVVHNFLKGTFNHQDNTLANILVSLKHAVTLYVDHDRYPVYNSFYKQKMKAKITHACDYILTYSSHMYKTYFNDDRILAINNFLNYRNISKIDTKETCIDNLYQARISTTKGAMEYYEFLNQLQGNYVNVLIGFGGSPAEINFKNLPGNILHIWKDTSRIQQNSDKTFLHVFPFEKEFTKITANLYASRFSWNCYRINSRYPENLLMDKGLEGAALESILCGTIPILNGHQRDLIIENRKLEDYNCCLFLDNNDIAKLVDDYKNCNYELLYNNLKVLSEIFSDKQRYIDNYNNIINYCVNTGKQQTAVIPENIYKELKDKNIQYLRR